MESIIHADIFFLITTVAIVICTIMLVVIGLRVLAILENVRAISDKVKSGVDDVSTSAKKVVHDIANDGVISTVSKMIHRERKARKRRT